MLIRMPDGSYLDHTVVKEVDYSKPRPRRTDGGPQPPSPSPTVHVRLSASYRPNNLKFYPVESFEVAATEAQFVVAEVRKWELHYLELREREIAAKRSTSDAD